jgi:hypothetical protein
MMRTRRTNPHPHPALAGVLLCATAALAASGCSLFTAQANPCPGAINQFDCTTFQVLFVAQSTVEAAKLQFAGVASAKPYVNKAVASFDLAEDAYQKWRALAAATVKAGGATPDAAALTALLATLASDLASLSNFKISEVPDTLRLGTVEQAPSASKLLRRVEP